MTKLLGSLTLNVVKVRETFQTWHPFLRHEGMNRETRITHDPLKLANCVQKLGGWKSILLWQIVYGAFFR